MDSNYAKLPRREMIILDKYDELEDLAFQNNVEIIQYPFDSSKIKGLYCDRVIALSAILTTSPEKACILAEELGHYHTTTGNILDQQSLSNRKQEQRARLWAYDQLIDLIGIVECFETGCLTLFEMAEHLGVTEEFLVEALERYRQKYGIYTTIDSHIIYFEPTLAVIRMAK